RTFIDSLKSRLPGLREEVPPKRDIFGEPVPAPGTPAERLLSPVLTSAPRGGQLASDMVEVDAKVGALSRKITVMGKPLQLDENDYDLYQQISGAAVKKMLSPLEDNDRFRQYPDAVRKQFIESEVKKARQAGHREFVDALAKSG